MRIMWSNDPNVPEHIKAALGDARGTRRFVLIVDRGKSTDAEVNAALSDFAKREMPMWLTDAELERLERKYDWADQ